MTKYLIGLLMLACSTLSVANVSDYNKPLWVLVDADTCTPIEGVSKSTSTDTAIVKTDENDALPSGDYGLVLNGSTNCDGMITFTKEVATVEPEVCGDGFEGTPPNCVIVCEDPNEEPNGTGDACVVIPPPPLTDADCAPQIANADGSACIDPPPPPSCEVGYEGEYPDCVYSCPDPNQVVNDSNDGCVPIEPPMTGLVYVNPDLNPEGIDGFTELRIRPSDPGYNPLDKSGTNEGDFRLNFNKEGNIGFTHILKDDPIVCPNEECMHWHMFFGNKLVDRDTDLEALVDNCQSNAHGGTANCSAYWIPPVVDTRTGEILPAEFSVYYKTQRSDDVTVPPLGLRMIGRPTNTIPTDFMCNEVYPGLENEIVACGQGGQVRFGVNFPNCWDGVNLDSPDHMSHMAYRAWGAECPASHPVMIPNITINVFVNVPDSTGTQHWKLACDQVTGTPGSCVHGDWVNGWNLTEAQRFVDNCLKDEKDCHADLTGDGNQYY